MTTANDTPTAVLAPTEASPLLGDGHIADQTPNYSGREAEANGPQNDQDEPERMGNPEVAKKMHLIVPAIGIGLYLVAVDQLLTVAAYAKIGNELNALNNMSWIATSYFLTLTAFQPLYGKLSDIFGRKECLLFAYAIFGIGCVGCGLARNMVELCVSRAVAGIGGGGMNAVVSILMSFLGQAPLCCIAWLAVYFVLDLPRPSHDHWLVKFRRIDFLGAFALVLAVTSLLTGLDFGSNLGWSKLATIIPLSLAPVFFAVFILIEARVASHPFAPAHIIFHPALFAGYLGNFFGTASQFGVFFFVPLFFQAVQGLSATESGMLLVPGMLVGVCASLFGGWVIKRTGKFYAITIISYGFIVLSLLPISLSVLFRSTLGETFGNMVNGFGGGCGITTILIGLLANSNQDDTAVVVACSYLFRSLGSSIGISISSAVMQQTLRSQLAARLPNGDQAREIEDRVRESLDYIKELPPFLADQVRRSYQLSILAAFAPTLVFGLAAFVVTFWVKEKSLKK
ncbi:major facilitator superfamily transporter [Pochonia chlamydosporia 170]|uniref:Major facilitator superfamily transporter n=1 Tax=Pochonia chlamydosporia 170 TaxID=1380566 RepID=A0A179FXI1_METCM|nr:major facilitator superfamily transporter [Pochonia chlamydosporia 170]OAQ70375.1 major facilitator superfamily transporter [Pochonia chlamydosporia 170]